VRELLQFLGLESDRLRIEWISASEGARFVEVVTDMSDSIKRLGPNTKMREDKT